MRLFLILILFLSTSFSYSQENEIETKPIIYYRVYDFRSFENWAYKDALKKNIELPPNFSIEKNEIIKSSQGIRVSGFYICTFLLNAAYCPPNGDLGGASYFVPEPIYNRYIKEIK